MPAWLGILLLLIGLGLGAGLVALFMRYREVSRQLRRLSEELGASDDVARQALAQGPDMALSIEILNPLELARANSRIGSSLAGVAPGLVRRRVYQTVSREVAVELEERGVQARVELIKGQ